MLGVKPSSMLHIGDNRASDVRQVRRQGLRAFWYETRSHREFKANKRFRKLTTALDDSLGFSVCAGLYLQREHTDDYWVEFGYKWARPIVYAFSRFIYNITQDIPVDKILFIARDGYMPQKVFDTFNTGIPTSYVYAPHLLAWSAYFYPVYEAQAQRFCEYFHIDSDGLSALDYIDLNAEEFRRLADGERQRARWGEYIKNILGEAKTAGVVVDDSICYTAQRMIEKESGIKTVWFYYRTGLIECNPCKSFAYFLAEHAKDTEPLARIIEFVLSAPEPTAKTMTDGAVVYRKITAEEQKAIDVASKIEVGVMQFARNVKERFAGCDIYLSKADIIALSDVFLKHPSGKDVSSWLDVKQVDAGSSKYGSILAGRVPLYSVSRLKTLAWRTRVQKVELALLAPAFFVWRVAKKLALRLVFREDYSLAAHNLRRVANRILKR